MIAVRSLHIYPVKSCRGISVPSAEITATGFRHDRRWMVVDMEGAFLSQRSHPAFTGVRTGIEGDRLILDARDLPPLELDLDEPDNDGRTVTVWNDTCGAVTEGADAARWFSTLLDTPCELVRQPEDAVRPVNPKYAEAGDRVSFADGYPFLLISQASVDELNRRLASPVAADRFRANIVVDGCPPHAEDDWSGFRIGEVVFHTAKPCARCVVITTDQLTGSRTAEPLKTLAGYRLVDGDVLFGQNLVHRGGGTIHVGDVIRSIDNY